MREIILAAVVLTACTEPAKAEPAPPGSVYVRDTYGNYLVGPRKDLPEALKAGAVEVAPEEMAKHRSK